MVLITEARDAIENIRKKAQELEFKYQDIFNHVTDGIVITDATTRPSTFLEVNDVFLKRLGYTREELIGNTTDMIITHKERTYFPPLPEIYEDLDKGKQVTFETIDKTKDGRIVPTEVSTRKIILEGREVYVSMSRDITERKKLEELQFNFETIFNESRDPMTINLIYEDGYVGEFLKVNNACCEALGYAQEEFMEYSPLNFSMATPESLETMPIILNTLKEKGFIEGIEWSAFHKDGSKLFFSINLQLISYMGKKCLLMSGRDITIQKKLLEEYQQFEAVFNQSRDPMVITTLNEDGSIGGYLKVNNAYVEIMGYTRDELAELTPLDIAKSESVEKIHVIANILKQGGFVEGLEWFTQTKDGTELCLSLNIQLIPLMGQQCVLVVGRDISLQKELISELKEAETQRMKFESMVAHELRTPLQAILGFTEVLDSHTDQLDENTLYMIISTIKKNIFRLENIVNTITDVSDIEHNIYGLNLEVHDFRNFMHEIQETYKHLGIRFFPWASDKPIFLNIDDKKLRMVFEHLIDNAIRNTNKNNRVVTVTPTLFKHSIQITISDNGAGIAQENLEKIFDKFVSIPTKYAVDGTGVGLYLARQILLAHSGTITANSEGVGHGATFTIHLPREDFLRRGLPIKSILADDFKLSKIHILMLHEISEIITEYLPIEHEVINFLLLKSAFRWLITKGQQETTDPLLTKSRIKEDFNNFMLMVEQTLDTIFPEPRWFKYVRVTMKAIKTHFQNNLKDIGSRQDLIESHSDKELFKYY